MRIVAVSDLHGDLGAVREALGRFRPDLLLGCGDWGDPGELQGDSLAGLIAEAPLLTTFGNHDDLEALAALRNRDGTPVLLTQGEMRSVGGVRIGAIGGIWAKSHRKPYYVTDQDVADAAGRLGDSGTLDVLLTHGCPLGMADLTPSGRHGGQRCFLDASRRIGPTVHLCGHLHLAQELTLRDGRRVLNVGATPEGSVVVIEVAGTELLARAERFPREEGTR